VFLQSETQDSERCFGREHSAAPEVKVIFRNQQYDHEGQLSILQVWANCPRSSHRQWDPQIQVTMGLLLAAVSWIPLCFVADRLLMDQYSKVRQGTGSNTGIKSFVVFNC